MNLKTVLLIFGVILVLVAGIIFLRFNLKNLQGSGTNQLPTTKVTIDKQTFTAEVAKTPKAQQQGLSDRKSLAKDAGMLFVFNKPGIYPFWMRKMDFPLDMIYINQNTIVQIFKNLPAPVSPTSTLPIYQSIDSADKVLEINAGLSDTYGFKKGDAVTISSL